MLEFHLITNAVTNAVKKEYHRRLQIHGRMQIAELSIEIYYKFGKIS